MIGIKNTSDKRITHMVDGSEYTFEPKEIKLVSPVVSAHLIKATYTCALGASPLKLVPLDAIPAEVSAGSVSVTKDILQLTNETETALDLMFDGEIYTIAPKGVRVFPADIGRALYEGHIRARRSGLVMSEVVPLRSEVSAPPAPEAPAPDESEPQPSMDREVSPEPDEPIEAPKKRGQKGKTK